MQRHTHTERSTRYHFESEQFIDAFLAAEGPGCKFHHDLECLCDVDVSKTEGMTWDQVPDDLVNVETPEDLVLAAANIWLNVDLRRPYVNMSAELEPQVPVFVQMVREHTNIDVMERTLHADVDTHTLALVREATNSFKPSNRNRPLPVERICKLHEDGYTVRMIFDKLASEMDWHPSLGRIYTVLRGKGLTPHTGMPKGYDKTSGLSYSEWRERYGVKAS